MNAMIVDDARGITLVGGGPVGAGEIEAALELAPALVAADSGAVAALAVGHVPLAVIGDLDSLPPAARRRLPPDRLHRIEEQDSTDFDKALRHLRAPLLLGVGFLGGRLDHQLAAGSSLISGIGPPCILIGAHEVVLAAPPRLAVETQPGDIVSLFPLRPVRGRSEGLHWAIDGIKLAPGGRVGTSNRATGAMLIETECPGLLVILPRARLAAAAAALRR